MIAIRRARLADAGAIAAVHVAVWRSTYPGILPDQFLARLSVARQTAYYADAIRSGGCAVFVAIATESDARPGGPRVVGFATGRPLRPGAAPRLAEGEIETLYVLDDFRERGLGRALIRALGTALAEGGCGSAFLWVLRDNPSRWFYRRLGGRPVAEGTVAVGGRAIPQTAFLWEPITLLLQASTQAT
ncbi:MAG: GNAT family N-acetyltransferase [Proteobacteria bacterium]|nr:GNAT family N-acetyltransferase [Pseudomonadota bacterium]